MQETLWLLYRRVGTLRAMGSISAWLVTVVRRACHRLAGKMFYRHETDIGPLEDDLRLSESPPHVLRLDLARAIRSLPEHYREIVLLRDIEEMTIDEIAATLSLSREAVKGRLHRARVDPRISQRRCVKHLNYARPPLKISVPRGIGAVPGGVYGALGSCASCKTAHRAQTA